MVSVVGMQQIKPGDQKTDTCALKKTTIISNI